MYVTQARAALQRLDQGNDQATLGDWRAEYCVELMRPAADRVIAARVADRTTSRLAVSALERRRPPHMWGNSFRTAARLQEASVAAALMLPRIGAVVGQSLAA